MILMITQHVPMYAAHLYDAVMLYATALGGLLKEKNLTEASDIIEAAQDGKALFQRIITKPEYNSEFFFLEDTLIRKNTFHV